MRSILAAGALLFMTAVVPAPVRADQLACDPNPLTQGHLGWMKMPSTAVDLDAAAPASATNPLLQDVQWEFPATTSTGAPVNPLTHQR